MRDITLINASNCSFFHMLSPPIVWELKKPEP